MNKVGLDSEAAALIASGAGLLEAVLIGAGWLPLDVVAPLVGLITVLAGLLVRRFVWSQDSVDEARQDAFVRGRDAGPVDPDA